MRRGSTKKGGKKYSLRCLLEDHEIWRVLCRLDVIFGCILQQHDLFGRMWMAFRAIRKKNSY